MQRVLIAVVTAVVVSITQPVWFYTDVCLFALEMVHRAGCVAWTAIMSLIRSHVVFTIVDAITDL